MTTFRTSGTTGKSKTRTFQIQCKKSCVFDNFHTFSFTVPHNYQQKLNDMNKLIAEYSGGAMKPKTFTGYIDEIWKECIANSDQCVVTGKKPTSKK